LFWLLRKQMLSGWLFGNRRIIELSQLWMHNKLSLAINDYN